MEQDKKPSRTHRCFVPSNIVLDTTLVPHEQEMYKLIKETLHAMHAHEEWCEDLQSIQLFLKEKYDNNDYPLAVDSVVATAYLYGMIATLNHDITCHMAFIKDYYEDDSEED